MKLSMLRKAVSLSSTANTAISVSMTMISSSERCRARELHPAGGVAETSQMLPSPRKPGRQRVDS